MKEFLAKYQAVFIALPILFILGNIFEPLSYLAFLGILIFLGLKKKNHQLIIFLLLIIILGDSREKSLAFVKQLRIISIMFLGFTTTVDLLTKKYRLDKLFFLIIIFYVIAIIGATRNYSFGTSFAKATSYVMLLYVGIHYLNYHIKESGQELLRDVFYLSVITFCLGLLFLFISPKIAIFGTSGRFRGVFGNPNGIGIYGVLMVMHYFLYLHILKLEPEKKWRLFFWGLLLFSVFISYSRGALLAVMIFISVQYIYKGSRIKELILYLMILPVGIILVNIDLLVSVIELFGLAEELRIETILTGSGRFFAWQWAWEVFQENIWIGRGFSFEEVLFHDHMPLWVILSGHQGGVHNSYLGFLLNVGILGTVIVVFIYLRLIGRIKARNLKIAFILTGLLSTFFEPWLNSSLNAYTAHFIMAILFYTHLYPQSNKKLKINPVDS